MQRGHTRYHDPDRVCCSEQCFELTGVDTSCENSQFTGVAGFRDNGLPDGDDIVDGGDRHQDRAIRVLVTFPGLLWMLIRGLRSTITRVSETESNLQ